MIKEQAALAIKRVLDTEQEAKQHVEACRKQAQAVEKDALSKASTMLKRADQRTTRLHQHCKQRLAHAINTLNKDEYAEHATRCRRAELSDDQVWHIADRLAAQLTGVDVTEHAEETHE